MRLHLQRSIVSLPALAFVLALILVSAGALAAPRAALADGDPASDVLGAAPPLYLPPDAGVSERQALALTRQLHDAAAAGHPIWVAVIATRTDLGAVTAVWGHPQAYAEFLWNELPSWFHGTLLVVMPSGFGVVRDGDPVGGRLSRLVPRSGQLLTATEQAVEYLTGVGAPDASAIAVPSGPSPTSGLGWWLTTLLAVVAVGGVWAASLRARPLHQARSASNGNDRVARGGIR